MSAGWNVVGTSVRGTSHFKSALPCQDACAYRVLDGGTLLAAVSDGAGTAARSDLGAQQAVNQTLLALSNHMDNAPPSSDAGWEILLLDTFHLVRSKVLKLADEEGGETRDYACTLTIVIANREWLVTGQIGDGLAVAQDESGSLQMIAEPQRGEYADATYFLTQADAPDIFSGRIYRQGQDLEPVRSLALMTDGLTHLAIDRASKAPHPPFFDPLFRVPSAIKDPEEALEGLYAFLTSERINQRTDDDKTLVLAGRVNG